MIGTLKQRFLNVSLKKKLTLIIMATTTAALTMAYAAFIVYDIHDIKRTKVQHLNTLAEMIGFNTAAAITFEDANDATKTLAGLAAEKNIERAVVYKPDYTVLAKYDGPNAVGLDQDFFGQAPPCHPGEARFVNNDLFVMRPISLQGECIGYVLLHSGLAELNSRVTRFVIISIALAGISLLIALLITSRLQRLISDPILHLAQVARQVTERRDYSARAQERGSDEVGVLICGFNEMLSEIQTRDSELQFAQQELQHRADALQAELTERLRAERETARMRRFLQNVIDSMPSVLVAVDEAGIVQQWNAQAERLTGVPRDQAHGAALATVYPALSREMESIYRAIHSATPDKRERVTMREGNEERFVDIMIYPLIMAGVEGAVVRVDDATERVRMEEMMIQTEKMMSVGGLAAGMAHEINNPLGIIVQSTQNVLRRISPDLRRNSEAAAAAGLSLSALQTYFAERGILEFLSDINAAGKRAATIVTNMLNFSRRTESASAPADLGELVRKSVELAASDYDLKKKYDFRKIEIVYEIDPQLPKVPCVETKIEQVILNLLRNAAQAISQQPDHGTPRIVCRAQLDGEMARIELEDNGPGMSEAVRRRVFEPFFTTKDVGSGTGLGLSVSYFIITDNHKGTMEVESSPGVGAKFVIRLPLTQPDAQSSSQGATRHAV
jgi:PAS domain S-box-containing protein